MNTTWTLFALTLGAVLPASPPPQAAPLPEPAAATGSSALPQDSWTQLLVSPQWLQENMDRRNLVILHASFDGADYAEGHIPGARLVLMDRIAWEGERGYGYELRPWREVQTVLQEAGVVNRGTVVVYGSNPMAAARLWMTLDVAGLATPLFLNGGIQLWQEQERPLTTLVPRVTPTRITLSPDPEKLVTAEWILARLGHDNLALLDARPDDEYTGADGGEGSSLNPGHIPSAGQLFWEELFESRERPVFLPMPRLRDKYRAAGATLNHTAVAYCHSGLRASVVYMIGRMLGYDMRLYDGSWRDWGSRDYPAIARGGGG